MDVKTNPQLKISTKETLNFIFVNICHHPSRYFRRMVTDVNGIKIGDFFRRIFS